MTCGDSGRMAKLRIETDREEDGRWIAHIPALPGVMVYGRTPADAARHDLVLAFPPGRGSTKA